MSLREDSLIADWPEEKEDYPSYPDMGHSTKSYYGTIVDHVPAVHTISCHRCGAYEHGDVGEDEDEAEARFFRERGNTCWDWWLAKLARDVIET